MNEEKLIKIVIMGMDNAGKSTIVDLLSKDADSPSIPPKMAPTKGVSKDTLTLFDKNIPISVWDFGGQLIYRNKYIKDPKLYFHSISFFFYVVDVQDHVQYLPSGMYFKGVFQLIRKHSPEAKIIFLFHKMDPDFDPAEKNVKEQFMADIKPFINPSKVKYDVYDTTIYDLNRIKKIFEDEICTSGKS